VSAVPLSSARPVDVTAVWAGSELLVCCDRNGSGAAYRPADDRWDRLPDSPFPGRTSVAAVWTGREVLLWGGTDAPGVSQAHADGMAYDPAGRRWRVIPPAPIGPRFGSDAVWTGTEMLVWGGLPQCCAIDSVIHDPAAAAYDPVANSWRRLADVPPSWSGDDGSAATLVQGNGRVWVWRRDHLGWYDATQDRWVDAAPAPALPAPEVLSTADPAAAAVLSGDDLLVWTGGASGDLHGLAYRLPDGPWRRIADAHGYVDALSVGPGDRVFAALSAPGGTRVLDYRVAQDRWRELDPPPLTMRRRVVTAWTGEELLVWGGYSDTGPVLDGAVYRP